jgi:hypothetical protein
MVSLLSLTVVNYENYEIIATMKSSFILLKLEIDDAIGSNKPINFFINCLINWN